MPRGDSYQLQGQGGFVVLGPNEGTDNPAVTTYTGKYRWITFIEDTDIILLEGENLDNVSELSGLPTKAGIVLGGIFTRLVIGAGKAVIYKE